MQRPKTVWNVRHERGLSNEQQLPVKCFSSEEARDKNKSEQERVRESRKNDKNTTII